MNSLKKIPTTELLSWLISECELDYSSKYVYLYVRELAIRQAHRQHWALDYLQIKELVDTVATNIYLFVQRHYTGGFRLSNWLKYIYNTVYKTSLAMFPNGADVKPIVVDTTDDLLFEQEFLDRYFYNQIHQYYEFDEIDTRETEKYLYRYLYDCIVYYIKYNETYKYYNQIINSVLFNIILEHPVHLYGLSRSDSHYVDTIAHIIKNQFKQYLHNNFVIEDVSKHADITNKLIEYMQYERLQDVYDKI